MKVLGAIGLLACLLGCEGAITAPRAWDPTNPTRPIDPNNPIDPTMPPPPPDACEGVTVAAAPTRLRRLTVEQQRNSYREVMKDPNGTLDLAPLAGPVITELEVEKLNVAARALVGRKGHESYVKCNLAGTHDSACADQFIADFGLAVFRRPLTAGERADFKADAYETMRTNAAITPAASFKECIDATAEVMLQAPQYLYLHEEGIADATLPAGIRRLTGFERGMRLSYLLWNSTPDTALLDAAQAGQLDTSDGVRAQASRLLADPKARKAVRNVVSTWLELDGSSHQASLETAPKDKTRFPFDSPALRAAMREEVLALYERAFFDEGGSLKTLLTTPKAYVNRSLGQLYGVTAGLPASDATSAWVDLDTSQRGGLFTRAAFLALFTPQDVQSPIRRGVFLYRNVFGRVLGAPPPDVDNTPLKPAADALTVREQVEARTAPSSCQGCHARINPLGFVLSNYDAMGRFQTTETGTVNGQMYSAPIDATATLVGTDLEGEVKGPVALSSKLGDSGLAHDTMARVWFARANERAPVASDACSLQRLTQRFRQTDDMRDLLVSLSTGDSALFIQETP